MAEKQGLSSSEAGDLIGCGEDLFEDLAADYPWLKPYYLGKGRRRIKRWPREGVEALAYILRNQPSPEEASRENSPPFGAADGG